MHFYHVIGSATVGATAAPACSTRSFPHHLPCSWGPSGKPSPLSVCPQSIPVPESSLCVGWRLGGAAVQKQTHQTDTVAEPRDKSGYLEPVGRVGGGHGGRSAMASVHRSAIHRARSWASVAALARWHWLTCPLPEGEDKCLPVTGTCGPLSHCCARLGTSSRGGGWGQKGDSCRVAELLNLGLGKRF